MKKKAILSFFLLGAISMIVLSHEYLFDKGTGILPRKAISASLWYLITFRMHVLFGLLAITIGPFQFVNRIRQTKPTTHKLTGYFYLLSVTLSSLSGLVIAQYAMGGRTTTIGFTLLSLAWIFTAMRLITAARARDFSRHKQWSYYNYALTFAAITQRTLLLVPLLSSVPFIPIYRLSAWLPWLLNLIIAYFLLRISPARNEKTATDY